MGRNSLFPLQNVTEAGVLGDVKKWNLLVLKWCGRICKREGGVRTQKRTGRGVEGYFLRWNVIFSTQYLCVDEWMSERTNERYCVQDQQVRLQVG